MITHIYHQPQFGEDWFTYPRLYQDMVKRFPSGSTFVEIGAWKGKSSAYMSVEIANSGKQIDFYCIDTFEGSVEHRNNPELSQLYDIFKSNMKPVENYYTDMKMTSMKAVKKFENESIDFVFIDGSHEYEDIKDDITYWLPKVKRGGVLAGHDYYFPPQPPSWGLRNSVNFNLTLETDEYYKSNKSSAYKAVGEILGTQNIIATQDCYIYEKE
jgi:predicted O-methyltransferase YrrM